MVAAAIVAAGAISAGASVMGSSMAAGASKSAANTQLDMFERTRGDLQPFIGPGANALTDAYSLARTGPTGGGPDYVSMAYSNLPGRMTQRELEQTPGYQFTRDQGLKSVQSAAAARGLGVSGAALKGAAEYTTGLANKTYLDQFNVRQQQFADYLNLNTGQQANLQNQYNRLSDVAKIGQAAAAGQATAGTAAANAAGGYINQAGLASAAGLQGVGNSIAGAANNYAAYDAYKNALNPTMTGYGVAAAGTPGISAAGNPVMTGFAPSVTQAQIRAGYAG